MGKEGRWKPCRVFLLVSKKTIRVLSNPSMREADDDGTANLEHTVTRKKAEAMLGDTDGVWGPLQ